MGRFSDERGQTSAEYLGVLVMIAGLAGALALAAPGIGSLIEDGIAA
jgi:hypothetical protein